MSKRRRRRRPPSRAAPEAGALLLSALGHAVTLGSLAVLGPPPAVRVDARWVNDHRITVQCALAGLALAAAASLAPVARRGRRLPLAVLWLVAAAAAAWFFSDRIPLIARVLLHHAF